MEFLRWSCHDVALWIESIGFPSIRASEHVSSTLSSHHYSAELRLHHACFTENFITGRKLVLISCMSLPKLGISDFQHMKLRELLGVSEPRWSRSVADPPDDDLTGFLKKKSRTGQHTDSLTLQQFLINNSK
ncbi:unnamed protein product [Leuciscus chuanchicus]